MSYYKLQSAYSIENNQDIMPIRTGLDNVGIFESCIGTWDPENRLYNRNTPPESLKCCLDVAGKYYSDEFKVQNVKNSCWQFYRNNVLNGSPFNECAKRYCPVDVSNKEDKLVDMNKTYDQLFPLKTPAGGCVRNKKKEIMSCIDKECDMDNRCSIVNNDLYNSFVNNTLTG